MGTIQVTSGGSGYTTPPRVTITNASGDTVGKGATAMANIDTTGGSSTMGQVTSIDIVTVGSGYAAAPQVAIAPPASGTAATAKAVLYTAPTEVGMVPAVPGSDNFPAEWTAQTTGQPGDILDNRMGGVPDPALIGPSMIQIGTEGGFLPTPVVWTNIPIGWDRDPKSITIGNVKEHNLFIGPAERADVIDRLLRSSPARPIILYNDGPAAVPATDSRLDYYTNDLDQTAIGGATKTVPGYGPDTRTIMQIKVNAAPAPALQPGRSAGRVRHHVDSPGRVRPQRRIPIIVPQAGYNTAYNASFPVGHYCLLAHLEHLVDLHPARRERAGHHQLRAQGHTGVVRGHLRADDRLPGRRDQEHQRYQPDDHPLRLHRSGDRDP